MVRQRGQEPFPNFRIAIGRPEKVRNPAIGDTLIPLVNLPEKNRLDDLIRTDERSTS